MDQAVEFADITAADQSGRVRDDDSAMMVVVEPFPAVRYARSGDVNIAYTRWGKGSHVVVYTPPMASNVELFWGVAGAVAFVAPWGRIRRKRDVG